ncbi:hypothetical protein FHR84_000920 [Actinopolyspora biskrensis]|uniref:Uncharacterized protein n=1 Tax=Actinopolyspora biskrensis TaxID=1470178 RepID=A0A852Z1U7_9ACTN|nr:hypothetical protein [Actinopolyspora biskrensis]
MQTQLVRTTPNNGVASTAWWPLTAACCLRV